MALPLFIHPCIGNPARPLHPPPPTKPLRIQIEGPLVSIEKLLPSIQWFTYGIDLEFPQPAGPALARLTYRTLYGLEARPDVAGDIIVRNEFLGWVMARRPEGVIDYYGVTFDHFVPADDLDPDILQINIIEVDDDGGEYANLGLSFAVIPADYTRKKVLAVPRCCQKRRGTQDRGRINDEVNERDELAREEAEMGGS